jgi:hypothetical protein
MPMKSLLIGTITLVILFLPLFTTSAQEESKEDADQPAATLTEESTPSSSEATPNITSPSGDSPEEAAVYNECDATSPKEFCNDVKKDDSFITQIVNAIKGKLNGLFFFLPKDEAQTFVEAEVNRNARIQLPSDQETNSSTNAQGVEDQLSQLKGFLSGPTSFYGAMLPKLEGESDIKASECLYEKANFPDGINPITNQNCQ